MKPPIYYGLMKYISKQRIRFNSPGHKGKVRMRTDNLGRLDLGFSPDTDNFINPGGYILQSEEQAAAMFGAKKSFYLTGGNSAGIFAMLAAVCVAGDKVIVDSECDKAVISAITMLALNPVFIKRSYSVKYGINGGINIEELDYTAEKHHDAKAILITSPTYYGICANIKKAAEIAGKNNMFLLVDESLGAHFNFSGQSELCALSCGAHMVVHDMSKTLGAFCGNGFLHLATDKIDPVLIREFLDIYQSAGTSVSSLCATENALYYAFKNAKKYDSIFREIERGKHIINTHTDIIWFSSEYNNGCNIDKTDITRIVLNFSKTTANAVSAAKILMNKYGIEPESADSDNIVFSVSLYNTPGEIRKLVNSCYSISKLLTPVSEPEKLEEYGENAVQPYFKISIKMPPFKAFHCDGESVHFREAAGRICRKMIYKMPKSTPLLIPGEKITALHIEKIEKILQYGGILNGLGPREEIEVLSLGDSFYF